MYQYFGSLYAEEFRRPDNVAFYIHCKDPVNEELPDCLLRKRIQPTREQLEMKQQLAGERRSYLEERKINERSTHLARVSLIVDRHRRRTVDSLQALEDRMDRDMNDHVRRRTELLDARLKRLSQHINEVGERCDLVRHEKFLKKLTATYEASLPKTSDSK